MTFKFPCPHCGQRVAATDELVGESVVCPTCSQNFVVRSPAELPAIAMTSGVSGALPAANYSRSHYWAIFGTVFVLTISGGLFFWSNKKLALRAPHTASRDRGDDVNSATKGIPGLSPPAVALPEPNLTPSSPGTVATQASLIPGLDGPAGGAANAQNATPQASLIPGMDALGGGNGGSEIIFPKPESTDPAIQAKLNKIIFPRVDFRDTTLSECVDFLNHKSRELDPQSVGVSVVIDPSIPPSTTGLRLTLQLNNVPQIELLNYVTHLCGLKFRIFASGVTLLPKDDTKSFEWLQMAAVQGYPDAQRNLGVMYGTGQGVPKDDTKAFEWFLKAAVQGDPYAQRNLGMMYGAGRGVALDATKAIEWFQKAADQGNDLAQNDLGFSYRVGQGVPKDDTKAFKWFQKAADQGSAPAQNDLGVMYENGQGIPKDDKKAIEWYQKGAAQGNADAQYNLGSMYANGQGVPMDDKKAFEWFQKAATQGNAAAKEWVRNYTAGSEAKRSPK